MSVWNHVPIPWEKFSCLLNAWRTVIWTFLWTKNSTELGKAVFNLLSPYLCYSYKYDHARCGRGDMLHLKRFIILTLCYANLHNCQKFTSGERFLRECVFVVAGVLPAVCWCDLIINNGMSCWPNICAFSDWLLCASYHSRLSQTDRVDPRGCWSGSDHLFQISPHSLSQPCFTSVGCKRVNRLVLQDILKNILSYIYAFGKCFQRTKLFPQKLNCPLETIFWFDLHHQLSCDARHPTATSFNMILWWLLPFQIGFLNMAMSSLY